MANSWRVSRALDSMRALSEVIDQMTQEELVETIQLEEASLRRKSVLTALHRRSRVLARIQHQAILKEKLNGP